MSARHPVVWCSSVPGVASTVGARGSLCSGCRLEVRVRVFVVRLPSGARYWTVLAEDLRVCREADEFLRHVRICCGAGRFTGIGGMQRIG